MASEPPFRHVKQMSGIDIKTKNDLYKNSNTAANEKKAVKYFKLFLEFNEQNLDFFHYTKPQLDECLGKFYLGMRTEKAKYYSSGSLHTLRYELNTAVQEFGHQFNITNKKYTGFVNSNKAFKLALTAGKSHRNQLQKLQKAISNKNYYTRLIIRCIIYP